MNYYQANAQFSGDPLPLSIYDIPEKHAQNLLSIEQYIADKWCNGVIDLSGKTSGALSSVFNVKLQSS